MTITITTITTTTTTITINETLGMEGKGKEGKGRGMGRGRGGEGEKMQKCCSRGPPNFCAHVPTRSLKAWGISKWAQNGKGENTK